MGPRPLLSRRLARCIQNLLFPNRAHPRLLSSNHYVLESAMSTAGEGLQSVDPGFPHYQRPRCLHYSICEPFHRSHNVCLAIAGFMGTKIKKGDVGSLGSLLDWFPVSPLVHALCSMRKDTTS